MEAIITHAESMTIFLTLSSYNVSLKGYSLYLGHLVGCVVITVSLCSL